MGRMKDETIADFEPEPYGPCHHTQYAGSKPCIHIAYAEGYESALRDAVAAVFHCLAWEDEQLDADGHPRLYLWQDHALAAINKLRGQP